MCIRDSYKDIFGARVFGAQMPGVDDQASRRATALSRYDAIVEDREKTKKLARLVLMVYGESDRTQAGFDAAISQNVPWWLDLPLEDRQDVFEIGKQGYGQWEAEQLAQQPQPEPKTQTAAPPEPARDTRINARDPELPRTNVERMEDNREAIELLFALEEDERAPTEAERQILGRYTGFNDLYDELAVTPRT